MKGIITLAVLVIILGAGMDAHAQVPAWIKNTAGFWAEGQITDMEFVAAIQYLISQGVIQVNAESAQGTSSDSIPAWIKQNAMMWVNGTIDDSTFLYGIEYLVNAGIISVQASAHDAGSPTTESKTDKLVSLEADLAACGEIKKAYDRLNCKDDADLAIAVYHYKNNADSYNVGPATFYYMGPDSDGNSLETRGEGRASLELRMLVENNGNDNLSMFCSGPAVCNYDVWDGSRAFKYASTDFISGSLVLKPGQATEFNMLFGPNIGYGGTEFMYDPSLDYVFRISEPWGSANIPLDLK